MGATQSTRVSPTLGFVQTLKKQIKRTYRTIVKPKSTSDPKKIESVQIQANTTNIPRCSTFTSSCCFHCQHSHMEKCCRYSSDSKADAKKYAKWKTMFEFPAKPIRPVRILGLSDAVSEIKKPKKKFSFKAYRIMMFRRRRDVKPRKIKATVPPVRPQRRRRRARVCGNGIIIV